MLAEVTVALTGFAIGKAISGVGFSSMAPMVRLLDTDSGRQSPVPCNKWEVVFNHFYKITHFK